jgi:hypothetical protein
MPDRLGLNERSTLPSTCLLDFEGGPDTCYVVRFAGQVEPLGQLSLPGSLRRREFPRSDDLAGRLFHTLQIEEETTRRGFGACNT